MVTAPIEGRFRFCNGNVWHEVEYPRGLLLRGDVDFPSYVALSMVVCRGLSGGLTLYRECTPHGRCFLGGMLKPRPIPVGSNANGYASCGGPDEEYDWSYSDMVVHRRGFSFLMPFIVCRTFGEVAREAFAMWRPRDCPTIPFPTEATLSEVVMKLELAGGHSFLVGEARRYMAARARNTGFHGRACDEARPLCIIV